MKKAQILKSESENRPLIHSGVELAGIDVKKIKALRGGKMHDKFCVIDNQVVITGSYNWSDNAEFKNDEKIAILRDNNRASDFSVEYRHLVLGRK